MVVDRASGGIEHRRFRDLGEIVPAGDLLVLNTTRVRRARLLGQRDSGAPAEILLLSPLGEGRWEAMVKPGARLKPGRVVRVATGFDVHILGSTDQHTRVVRLEVEGDVDAAIERHGHVPLPPYIARDDTPGDADRYQTVYAEQRGSVAAPTAGLHFTPDLLAALAAKGVRRADVVLHVGAGTFRPVSAALVSGHAMHAEWFRVPAETAAAVNRTRDERRSVWGVGTTSLRALESVLDQNGRVRPGEGETRIFIHPPQSVRSIDHLVTNFHLPRSTLLMLVAAFAGLELTRHVYKLAIREGYRFYSYGDSVVWI
jgi:S-adenosylmethionine:tRNA ribosyltransferase-isomerase